MKKQYHTHGLGRSAYKFRTSISVEKLSLPKNGLSQLLIALILSKYIGMNPLLWMSAIAQSISAVWWSCLGRLAWFWLLPTCNSVRILFLYTHILALQWLLRKQPHSVGLVFFQISLQKRWQDIAILSSMAYSQAVSLWVICRAWFPLGRINLSKSFKIAKFI